jgi:hypothetical protein
VPIARIDSSTARLMVKSADETDGVGSFVIGVVLAAFSAGCSASTNSADLTGAQGTSAKSATTTSAAVAPAAAYGVEAAIDSVPWSQVGPGWTLATWSPVTGTRPGVQPPPGTPSRDNVTTTLYLVDPAGGRYPVTTFPPPGTESSPDLVDWSGDGSHALFYAQYAKPPAAIIVDLHSGKQTTVPVDGNPRFTRPDGQALLLAGWGDLNHPAPLQRVDLEGKPQLTYPSEELGFSGSYLSTPDGNRLVLGTSTGLAVLGNDGTPGAKLSIPGQSRCTPMRWWDEDPGHTVLAGCDAADSYRTGLWLVPIDGGEPTAVTASNNHDGPDNGDVNAWKLPAGTFVQALGGCGTIYLAKLNADGTTTKVTVPNTDPYDSVKVIGPNGNHLDVQALAACGPGQALLDFDPAANTSTFLLGGPINGGGVIRALAYPGQE